MFGFALQREFTCQNLLVKIYLSDGTGTLEIYLSDGTGTLGKQPVVKYQSPLTHKFL
jgi:hypothetical protein